MLGFSLDQQKIKKTDGGARVRRRHASLSLTDQSTVIGEGGPFLHRPSLVDALT